MDIEQHFGLGFMSVGFMESDRTAFCVGKLCRATMFVLKFMEIDIELLFLGSP